MKRPAISYRLLNGLFHVVHVTIILFIMLGWIVPSLRIAHLALVLLTLSSWFILGQWLGTGYCPVSDWHWKLKAALGEGKPNGTYIHQLLQTLTGRELKADVVDKCVVIGTFVILGISLMLNLSAFAS